jgi:hypothetical protein
MIVKSTVVWDMTSFGLVEVSRLVLGWYCFSLQHGRLSEADKQVSIAHSSTLKMEEVCFSVDICKFLPHCLAIASRKIVRYSITIMRTTSRK